MVVPLVSVCTPPRDYLSSKPSRQPPSLSALPSHVVFACDSEKGSRGAHDASGHGFHPAEAVHARCSWGQPRGAGLAVRSRRRAGAAAVAQVSQLSCLVARVSSSVLFFLRLMLFVLPCGFGFLDGWLGGTWFPSRCSLCRVLTCTSSVWWKTSSRVSCVFFWRRFCHEPGLRAVGCASVRYGRVRHFDDVHAACTTVATLYGAEGGESRRQAAHGTRVSSIPPHEQSGEIGRGTPGCGWGLPLR